MNPNILIIAGEPSGDSRGAELIKALKPLIGKVSFWGFGGDNMAGEGVEIIRHVRELSMVGVVEIIHKLPQVIRHYTEISRLADQRKPCMAILIDYPGFNLKVAKCLRAKNIPVVYYIIPQVWAWGLGRIKKIKRYVRKALVLFPFEEKLLREHGVDCDFVGHPIVDAFEPWDKRLEKNLIQFNKSEEIRIALLPGSRKHEINNILPVMLKAAELIKKHLGKVSFMLAESPNIETARYDSLLSCSRNILIERKRGDTAGILSECDFSIITSGTATLEGAMMLKPMVVVYKASLITYLLFLIFAKTRTLGLVNIISGKEIAPEIMQNNLNAENLAEKVIEIITDNRRIEAMKKDMANVKKALGEKGAAKKAALAVSSLYKSLYDQP